MSRWRLVVLGVMLCFPALLGADEAEPTSQQVMDAEIELAKWGARLRQRSDPYTGQSRYVVSFPSPVRDAQLQGFPNLPFSFGLSMGGTDVTDAGLPAFSGLTNLTYLNLQERRVTGEGLKALSGLTRLTHLDLKETRVTDAGMKELKGLTRLTYLNIERTNVTAKGLLELEGLKNLSLLHLDKTLAIHNLSTLRKAGLLHALPWANGREKTRPADSGEIVSLDFTGPDMSTSGLTELRDCKNLTWLEFNPVWVTDRALTNLHEIGLLHALWRAKSTGDTRPASAAEVASLNLRDTRVTHEGLKELRDLTNLTSLELDKTQLTDKALAALREIEMLHVIANARGESGARPKSAADVASLDLRGTRITTAGLKELEGFSKLSRLDLSNTKVTNAGLKELRGFSNLTYLNLVGCKATAAGVRELQQVFPDCEIAGP